jgi:hypothetical protein
MNWHVFTYLWMFHLLIYPGLYYHNRMKADTNTVKHNCSSYLFCHSCFRSRAEKSILDEEKSYRLHHFESISSIYLPKYNKIHIKIHKNDGSKYHLILIFFRFSYFTLFNTESQHNYSFLKL